VKKLLFFCLFVFSTHVLLLGSTHVFSTHVFVFSTHVLPSIVVDEVIV
jgi:hypothetical protein